jgi:hypothetical protein
MKSIHSALGSDHSHEDHPYCAISSPLQIRQFQTKGEFPCPF